MQKPMYMESFAHYVARDYAISACLAIKHVDNREYRNRQQDSDTMRYSLSRV